MSVSQLGRFPLISCSIGALLRGNTQHIFPENVFVLSDSVNGCLVYILHRRRKRGPEVPLLASMLGQEVKKIWAKKVREISPMGAQAAINNLLQNLKQKKSPILSSDRRTINKGCCHQDRKIFQKVMENITTRVEGLSIRLTKFVSLFDQNMTKYTKMEQILLADTCK